MAIRTATPSDVDRIKQLAADTNMFIADEVEFFDEMLGGFLDGSLEGWKFLVSDSLP